MIDWMVSSSVLIAAVVTLRRVLRGRMSPRLQYALWALVLVRLLLPVSFGTTRISVLNTVSRPAQTVQTSAQPEAASDADAGMLPEAAPLPSAGNGASAAAPRLQNTADLPSPAQGPSLRQVLLSIWAGGAAVMAGLFLWANGRLSRRLRRSRTALPSDGRLPVFVTAAVETPCLFGLFRPAVYVTPEAAEDPSVLYHTVTHERCHRRQGDHVWAVLRCAALCLHWYNPLVWLAAVLSRSDGELACDAATVRQLGEAQRAAYGWTLIEMTCRKPTALLVTATTMTGGARGLKERITMLVKKPKTAVSVLLIVVLIAAVAVGCTFTGAADTTTPEGDAGAADTEGTGTETMEATDGIPAAIWEHAQREVDYMVDYYTELGGSAWKPLASTDVSVTEIPLGEAAREAGAHLYRLGYRIQVDDPEAAAAGLPAGTVLDGNQITEATAEGSPYMAVQTDASSPDGWQETHGFLYDRTLELLYNTVDMVEQYGDAYTAAAVECCGSDTTAAVDGSEYLNDVFAQLRRGAAVRLVMTADDGSMVIGDHFGTDSDNAALFIGQLAMHTYDCITPGVPNTDLPAITILAADEWRDWKLEFWEGSDRVQLTVNGETYGFAAEAPDPRDAADYPVGTLARLWYDEAEFQSAGGMNTTMEQQLIPDAGQDYLQAARQLCQAQAEIHLNVTNGSKYAYTYVNCTVKPAEERTEAARAAGEIGRDTWAFYVTTVFVPENQRALDWSMAGNTGGYTGSDPDVPEGAWEYGRCGYVTRTAAGWYAEIVGTGW